MEHPSFAALTALAISTAFSVGLIPPRATSAAQKGAVREEAAQEADAQDETTEQPNVLFIAIDDLRPALGCYGDPYAKTPHMDELAARGVRFDRAYCQVAVCNPSRASIMTGKTPDHLGVWTLPIHFREAQPDAVTMPQWFREHGYTAVSHGKIYHNPTPDPQSWSEPIRPLPKLPYPYPEGTRELIKKGKDQLPKGNWRKTSLRGPSTAAPELEDELVLDGARTQMAIEDLRRLGKADEPFFLAMGYVRPHLAFVAPKKYWDLYDRATLPLPEHVSPNEGAPRYALHNNSEISHYVDMVDVPKPWDEERVSEAKTRELVHGYYACVSYVDAQIGALLDALDDEGLTDNTVVVLWSDHGWKLGEYGGWGKMTNYEIDTRVPMILSAPGQVEPGQATSQLVELLDVYPTLCELTGVPTPDFVDGKSTMPLLEGIDEPIHAAASSQYYRKMNGEEFMGYSIRTDRYRFVEWRDFSTGDPLASELYDTEADPAEVKNLIDVAAPELVDRLRAQLLDMDPRGPLSLLPAIHATEGTARAKTQMIVENASESPVKVYAINRKGRRGKPKTVAPGDTLTLATRLGAVFVAESEDGRIYEVHSPSLPARTIALR